MPLRALESEGMGKVPVREELGDQWAPKLNST